MSWQNSRGIRLCLGPLYELSPWAQHGRDSNSVKEGREGKERRKEGRKGGRDGGQEARKRAEEERKGEENKRNKTRFYAKDLLQEFQDKSICSTV